MWICEVLRGTISLIVHLSGQNQILLLLSLQVVNNWKARVVLFVIGGKEH